MIQEPAFELLRQFKQVSNDTEILVMKVVKKKYGHLTAQDLYNIFELGIQGEYGKLYSADPQTLIGWVEDYLKGNQKKVSYYERPVLSPSVKITDRDYPSTNIEWEREVNKSYIAFLNGLPYTSLHPDIYSRLSLDSKIQIGSYKKYYEKEEDWDISRQKIIAEYFTSCKLNGVNEIYYVK